MPRDPLLELLDFAVERDLELTLYSERHLYVANMRQSQAFYDLWFGLDVVQVPSLRAGLDMIDEQGLCPLKCLIIGERDANDRLTQDLQARFAGRLDIVRSHDLFVEAVSPVASKGRAVAHVAEHFGIARSETVAVGDSGNDLSMIQWAGVGVAMANASPDVRAAADWIAPAALDDGVVHVVERYVLGSGR